MKYWLLVLGTFCLLSQQAFTQCTYIPTVSISGATCSPGGDGAITIVVTPASAYTYVWNTSATTASLTGLVSASYTVTVSDGSCDTVLTLLLPTDTISSLEYTFELADCNAANGYIVIDSVLGGQAPHQFSSDNITYSTDSLFNNLATGLQKLYVNDAAGCLDSFTIDLPAPTPVVLSFNTTNMTCDDFGIVDLLEPLTGTPPFTYKIRNETSSVPFSATFGTGDVFISVVDGNGCETQDYARIDDDCTNRKPTEPVGNKRFSPNDDGINDFWTIGGISSFPNSLIIVFNKWGQQVFNTSGGYDEPWDGKSAGVPVPEATYYYVIYLNSADASAGVATGNVAVIR